jgi:hypothetical protein
MQQMIISHISHLEEIYLDERVKYMVNALQIIKKEPKANTVPENNCSVALNIDPKEIGPVARSQCFHQNIYISCHKSKQLAYCSSECRHES